MNFSMSLRDQPFINKAKLSSPLFLYVRLMLRLTGLVPVQTEKKGKSNVCAKDLTV